MKMEQIAMKRRKEVEDTSMEESISMKQTGGQVEEEESGSKWSQKSPSPEPEEETNKQSREEQT